mgnify:CR=1 FL=1
MMTTLEIPSVLSSSQRRCQVLLMLYLPDAVVTAQSIIAANGVDDAMARQDIAETRDEIQRYHRLDIVTHHDGSYRIEGAVIDQRLCLLHGLRRALRLCPHFIAHHFTPALKTQLKLQGIARTLYDDTNLQALVNPDDDVNLRRILNVPKRGLGDKALARIHQFAQIERAPLFHAASRITSDTLGCGKTNWRRSSNA